MFDLIWQPAQVTEIYASGAPEEPTGSGLVLRHASLRRHLQPGLGEFSIGRAGENDLVVMSGSVSRRHATVDYGRDRFVLVDRSTNGTYVLTQEGETVFLRRESLPLWGHGRMALGAPPEEGEGHVIEFECL